MTSVGLELRASGATYTGAVCMNLLRHPAWGRAQETYGEDPHHVGRMAAAFTRGLERHVMACMKHFAVNSMENARFTVDVTADERALHEVYLPHFRHVAEEGIASVMSAYNSLNGEWCGENETLLTTILRDEWGWDGFVISDFIFGLRDAVKSVEAGLDIEMPFRQQRAVALDDAVADGRLDEGAVDRCVQRVVATLLRYADVVADGSGPVDRQLCASPGARPRGRRGVDRDAAQRGVAAPGRPRDDRQAGRRRTIGCGAEPRRRRLVGREVDHGGDADRRADGGIPGCHGDASGRHVERRSTGRWSPTPTSWWSSPDTRSGTKGEYIDNAGTMALAGDLFPPMDHPELGFPPRPADDAPRRRRLDESDRSTRRRPTRMATSVAWPREGTGSRCGSRMPTRR